METESLQYFSSKETKEVWFGGREVSGKRHGCAGSQGTHPPSPSPVLSVVPRGGIKWATSVGTNTTKWPTSNIGAV